ncbi:TetR/AcrR family transcriptional regulator [Pseudaestuariivita atlantica]|uniref:HTH tetR-type domain-containing protein n=1 Tax=Pseudaestuariivita atlantica TaxID=1317121 RepID=A0A0L1JNP3_9RHOB|nr:TetR/AcrR family transcriptional regulator [Pseudaestuariivita atlantica]KNG93385.1 hypothetical protein ATO11_13205 [Pseudaestuariivita atlantica]
MARHDDTILTAALTCFSRYGYAKTTMTDIAREAKVARATVYNTYDSKPDILRAVVKHVTVTMQDKVVDAWKQVDTLDERIDAFFTAVPVAIYDMITTQPEMAELVDEMAATAPDEMIAARADWVDVLATMFRDADVADPQGVADFFYSSAINAKYGSDNRDQVLARLATLKSALLAMVAAQ